MLENTGRTGGIGARFFRMARGLLQVRAAAAALGGTKAVSLLARRPRVMHRAAIRVMQRAAIRVMQRAAIRVMQRATIRVMQRACPKSSATAPHTRVLVPMLLC